MAPERAATLEELRHVRGAVEELRQSVGDLNRVLERLVTEKVAEVSIPRKEIERRLRRSGMRVVLGLVAVLAVAALLIGLNRATLQQAQEQAADDISTLITRCRTTTPTISDADLRFCSSRIPGFPEARANAAKVAATAKRNDERLDRLEREVARLKR